MITFSTLLREIEIEMHTLQSKLQASIRVINPIDDLMSILEKEKFKKSDFCNEYYGYGWALLNERAVCLLELCSNCYSLSFYLKENFLNTFHANERQEVQNAYYKMVAEVLSADISAFARCSLETRSVREMIKFITDFASDNQLSIQALQARKAKQCEDRWIYLQKTAQDEENFQRTLETLD